MWPLRWHICVNVYKYILEANCSNLNGRWSSHYNGVIMGAIASQITSLTIVYSVVYSDADQRKHRRSASLAFVWGIHRGPVNSPHNWPVTRKMFPFDDIIMTFLLSISCLQDYTLKSLQVKWAPSTHLLSKTFVNISICLNTWLTPQGVNKMVFKSVLIFTKLL